MKRLLFAVSFMLVFWACMVQAQDKGVDFTTQAEIFSASPWRLICYEPGHTALLAINYGDLGVSVFQYSKWPGGNPWAVQNDELDISASYSPTGHLTLIATIYSLPAVGEMWYTRDVGFVIKTPLSLSPTLEFFYDFGKFQKSYVGLTFSEDLPLQTSVAVTFGVNNGQWLQPRETLTGVTVRVDKTWLLFGEVGIITQPFILFTLNYESLNFLLT